VVARRLLPAVLGSHHGPAVGCGSSGCDERFHSVQLAKGANPQAIALDPATRTLYVADGGTSTVSVIDAATCNAEDVSGCATAPRALDKGFDAPNGVAVDPLTDTVYVANCGALCGGQKNTDTVSVIDGATCNAEVSSCCGETPAAVTVGAFPDALSVDPATDTVYVADVLTMANPSPFGGGLGDRRGDL
jgi:DNA-binding beta-propeller fold protein YncE